MVQLYKLVAQRKKLRCMQCEEQQAMSQYSLNQHLFQGRIDFSF